MNLYKQNIHAWIHLQYEPYHGQGYSESRVTGHEAEEFTPDRTPVHHRAPWTHTHTYSHQGQFRTVDLPTCMFLTLHGKHVELKGNPQERAENVKVT